MNEKGFTLVELLAVIVILALLTLLTSTAVTKLVSDSKEELSNTQINLIKAAAETWGAENLMDLPDEGECSYLTLQDLKYYGLLDSNIIDPKNNEEISDDLKIKITTELNSYDEFIIDYEVNPESVEGCSQKYICTIAQDSTVSGLNAGAKYNCKVDPNKDPYTFYVLTKPSEDSTTVNLIMDSNINASGEAVKSDDMTDKGLVAWINNEHFLQMGGNQSYWDSKEDMNLFGPITVLNYLESATSNWKNLTPITIGTYVDSLGNTNNIAKTYKMYARLPYYEELHDLSNETVWLIDYLNGKNDATIPVIGRNSVNSLFGYWIFSSSASGYYYSLRVTHRGSFSAVKSGGSFGVRPVITIPIDRITQ